MPSDAVMSLMRGPSAKGLLPKCSGQLGLTSQMLTLATARSALFNTGQTSLMHANHTTEVGALFLSDADMPQRAECMRVVPI